LIKKGMGMADNILKNYYLYETLLKLEKGLSQLKGPFSQMEGETFKND
jgi:hypothetical protein